MDTIDGPESDGFAATRRAVTALARHLKNTERDADPTLIVVRDGAPIAVVAHPEIEVVLDQASIAAAGYGAHALGMVIEGQAPPNAAGPGPAARSRFADCLVVTVVDRSGAAAAIEWPFRSTAGGLEWGERTPVGGAGLAPPLGRALRRPPLDPARMRDPGHGLRAGADDRFLPPDRGRVFLDVGTTRVISTNLFREAGYGEARLVFPAPPDPSRVQGLQHWQIIVVDPV